MRLVPLILALALSACASKPKLPDTGPGGTGQLPIPAASDASDDRVVAFIDGRPILWRDVTEHAMTAGGKQLIDEYIRWKLRHDVSRKLGVANTPDEIRARAKSIVEFARKSQGDAKVDAALKERGLTEAQYVETFVADPLFGERLIVEKTFTYALLTLPSIEIDTVSFTDEGEAREFVERVRDTKDFDDASRTVRGSLRLWPRRRMARGYFPATLAHLEERLLAMAAGDVTGVERTPGNAVVVLRVAAKHEASTATYDALRGTVMEELLRSPPGEEQIKTWLDRLFRGSKIQYEDRYTSRDKVR